MIEIYNKLCEEKEQLLLDRKVLVRFLELRNKRYPDTLIDLSTLSELMFQVLREDKSADLSLLGNFIHEFKREKQLFKEDQFNLFEMVNFIHEKKYSRAQFEIISHFINRLRKAYNVSKNLPKDQYVDPRTPFTNSFLSTTFEALCKKAERQSDSIETLIKELEQEYERYKGPEATLRTNRIIEYNVMGDYILKRFTYLDNRLLEALDKLEELGNYLTQEEIDQVPMEEVRRRTYQILTGQELREQTAPTKKLEGFKNLLKKMKTGDVKEEEERRKTSFKDFKDPKGNDKLDNVSRLLFEKEKELNEKERAREIEYERERERERDKLRAIEIENDRKKAKAEKDEWDWEAALGGGDGRDSVLKNSSAIKEAKDDELDGFISLLNDKRPEKEKKAIEDSFVFTEEKNPMGGLARYQKMMAESDGFSVVSRKDKLRPEDLKTDEKKVSIKDVNLNEASTFKSTFLDTLKGLKMLNEGKSEGKSEERFESPESVKNAILKKNERLSKTLENVQDPNFLTKSTLKGRTDDAVILPDTVNLGRDKPKLGRYSDYEMLLPPDYYTFLAKKNIEMDKDPWYIRSHHIETLTGNFKNGLF